MLKELRNQHRTVIQMVFSGYKNNEIAERLEMTATTVSQIVRSPLGQAYLEGLQDKAQEATLDVRKKLVSMNKSALNVLDRIMQPGEKAPHSVQLNAAKDVLDRTGYKAPDRLTVDMTMQTKTDQEIDAEINAMQQSIAKTYLQDPNQLANEPPSPDENNSPNEETTNTDPIPFTDEHQVEEPTNQTLNKNSQLTELAQYIKTGKTNKEVGSSAHDGAEKSSPANDGITKEESTSLLSKLPPNTFKI